MWYILIRSFEKFCIVGYNRFTSLPLKGVVTEGSIALDLFSFSNLFFCCTDTLATLRILLSVVTQRKQKCLTDEGQIGRGLSTLNLALPFQGVGLIMMGMFSSVFYRRDQIHT